MLISDIFLFIFTGSFQVFQAPDSLRIENSQLFNSLNAKQLKNKIVDVRFESV